jgi:hypothetical protein
MSTESANTIRGHKVEKILIQRYEASPPDSDCYDMIYQGNFVEDKSSLSWHYKGKNCREQGRFSIEAHAHEEFKKLANQAGKKAIYAFVVVPRSLDDVIDDNQDNYREVWMTWENVDRLMNHRQVTSDKYYYRVPIRKVFPA